MPVLCQFLVFELWNKFHLKDPAKNIIFHQEWVFRIHRSGNLGCVLLAPMCSFLVRDISDIVSIQNWEMNYHVLYCILRSEHMTSSD